MWAPWKHYWSTIGALKVLKATPQWKHRGSAIIAVPWEYHMLVYVLSFAVLPWLLRWGFYGASILFPCCSHEWKHGASLKLSWEVHSASMGLHRAFVRLPWKQGAPMVANMPGVFAPPALHPCLAVCVAHACQLHINAGRMPPHLFTMLWKY